MIFLKSKHNCISPDSNSQFPKFLQIQTPELGPFVGDKQVEVLHRLREQQRVGADPEPQVGQGQSGDVRPGQEHLEPRAHSQVHGSNAIAITFIHLHRLPSHKQQQWE